MAPNKFRSEAVFQIGILTDKKLDKNFVEKTSMPISFFKEGEALIFDLDHMRTLMALDQRIGESVVEKYFKLHKKNQDIKKYFQRVYNFSTLQELPQNQGIEVIGFKLFYEAETRDIAKNIVSFYGNYIRSCYLAIDLSKYIWENIEYHNRSIREYENQESELNTIFEWTTNRRDKVQLLSKRFPIIKDVDKQQLIFMKNASTYSLSPKLTLIKIEALIIDINAEIKRLTWEKELSNISLKFFSQANKLLESDERNGIALLAKVNILKREIFAKENIKSSAVRIVDNSLSNDLQRFQDIYCGVFKFISGPVVFPCRTGLDRALQLIGIMTFNLILLLLVALLVHWWKRNWREITEKK